MPKSNPDVPSRARIITAVWGDDFIDTYLNMSLPALLSEGNLPSFGKLVPLSVNILTDSSGQERLKTSPAVEHLGNIWEYQHSKSSLRQTFSPRFYRLPALKYAVGPEI